MCRTQYLILVANIDIQQLSKYAPMNLGDAEELLDCRDFDPVSMRRRGFTGLIYSLSKTIPIHYHFINLTNILSSLI